jgi:hypothetical protein
LGLLGKKKQQAEKKSGQTEKTLTELEQHVGSDKEVYEALYNAMFLDPRKLNISAKEAVEDAKKFEKDKNFIKARIAYEIAGSIALYEVDIEKVKEYFGKVEKLAPERKYPILNNPEKAMAIAQEYYKKYLKT